MDLVKVPDSALEGLESAGSILGACAATYKLIQNQRFKKMARACADQLGLKGNIDDELKAKLDKFTQSSYGRDVTYNMLQKSLNAESEWGAKILGLILGKSVGEDRLIAHKDRIIVNAIGGMIDFDIELLVNLQAGLAKLPPPSYLIGKKFSDLKEFERQRQRNSYHINDFHQANLVQGDATAHVYTVEYLKSANVLTVTSLYNGQAIASDVGVFQLTDISAQIVEYALATKDF